MFLSSYELGVMVEVIYEIALDAEGHDSEKEDLKAEKRLQAQHGGGVTAWSRCNRLTAVSVVPLCVLLFVVSTVLFIKFNNLVTENNQQQPNYNNLTIERDELQTRYNNLTVEKDQLQTSYNILKEERDQLQSSYNTLTIERDQLKRGNDLSKGKWISFRSRMYYISNDYKSWEESRQDCREKGADLIIINSSSEWEFIIKQFRHRDVWIGLSDRDKEGEWKWVDDSPLLTFKGWGQGEPNGYKTENCVEIFKTTVSITWNDNNCSEKLNWICEKGFSP